MTTDTRPRDIGEFSSTFEEGSLERDALREYLKTALFSNDPASRASIRGVLRNQHIGKYHIVNWYERDSNVMVDLQNGTPEVCSAFVYELPTKDPITPRFNTPLGCRDNPK
jgi:hypothetical protein